MLFDFQGRRVLIAEDDYFVATELANEFRAANAQVIGPCASLAEATRLAPTSQMAVLDVDLRGQMVFPLADQMLQDGVPFVFYTGFDQPLLPPRFAEVVCINKPMAPQTTVKILARSGLANPQTIADLVPQLRLRARELMQDKSAADRLVELTLRRAIADPDPLPVMTQVGPWLERLMRTLAEDHGRRLLH
ncbi:response regulator [Pseudotabrizicola algicola]|uniref:Response regulator n=1 Tax=Pseudotabrizicola algicola TaxID=2709381 RepID=A0A6B3RKB4_9RHOB|nr:response regulator [Pseudotabrizicola algicola]NEX46464.1 response regulator [Pseudotabrizicola algicola]